VDARADRVDDIIEAWRRELPEIVGPTTEMAKRITLLAAALAKVTRRELNAFELTVAEYDVLVALRRTGSPYRLKPSHLVRELLLSSGGTAKVLKQLADRRLVERHPDAEDGRVAWVHLTAAGADLAERAVRATSAAQRELLRRLPPDVAETATDVLQKVSAVVKEV
jgi:DNA-binding MarR family transcriptional regulator